MGTNDIVNALAHRTHTHTHTTLNKYNRFRLDKFCRRYCFTFSHTELGNEKVFFFNLVDGEFIYVEINFLDAFYSLQSRSTG